MARVKIQDLPMLDDVTEEEQKGIFGGARQSKSPKSNPPATDPGVVGKEDPKAGDSGLKDTGNAI